MYMDIIINKAIYYLVFGNFFLHFFQITFSEDQANVSLEIEENSFKKSTKKIINK